MQLTQDQYDEIVMNLVVEGGNARSLAMEAIQAAKKGDFAQADQRMKECEEALVEVHNTQTEMIQAEIPTSFSTPYSRAMVISRRVLLLPW